MGNSVDARIDVGRLLAKLAPRQRAVLHLTVVEGLTDHEIGEVLGIDDPVERDAGTIACLAAGMMQGAHLFRVHNVAAAFQAVKVLEARGGSRRVAQSHSDH